MKTLRKNGGFTLVELIVVIAILAILAGVAVPAYSGYIKKAEDAKVITELDTIKTACVAEGASQTPYVEVKYINVDCTSETPAITFGASSTSIITNGSIDKYFTVANIDWSGTSYENGANWTPSQGWKAN